MCVCVCGRSRSSSQRRVEQPRYVGRTLFPIFLQRRSLPPSLPPSVARSLQLRRIRQRRLQFSAVADSSRAASVALGERETLRFKKKSGCEERERDIEVSAGLVLRSRESRRLGNVKAESANNRLPSSRI